MQAGFNSYVTKPVDFKELSKAMGTLLDPDAAASTKEAGLLVKSAAGSKAGIGIGIGMKREREMG